tara:strand:+ start:2298 stop:2558 length:261 start_codon:yes stop_codon:yes gene_type:complete
MWMWSGDIRDGALFVKNGDLDQAKSITTITPFGGVGFWRRGEAKGCDTLDARPVTCNVDVFVRIQYIPSSAKVSGFFTCNDIPTIH